jgi:glutamate N-acetyltransferase/amino-acid N-acetyltransferase
MISPDMATLLSFVVTDAAVSPEALQVLTQQETERTFNRITVDGDTSTNDTLFVLANGFAGNVPVENLATPNSENLRWALGEVLHNLARKIVADGEGATKFVEIRVRNVSSQAAALCGARAIANSPLVKTALFGEDANWGRILAALGRAGIDLDPHRVQLFFNDLKLVEDGRGCGEEAEKKASQIIREQSFSITVDLGQGVEEATLYTCDLSLDYVKINATYRS